MEWMDINIIKENIYLLRKENFGENEIKNEYIIENIEEAMNRISTYRNSILNKVNKNTTIFELGLNLLQVESIILNIIGIASYTKFDKNYSFDDACRKESKYAYNDYIDGLISYPEFYKNISILYCYNSKFLDIK